MSQTDAPATAHLVDAAATQRLGQRLAVLLQPEAAGREGGSAPAVILLLQGDLGSGKTCLVQGLAEGLGIGEAITSPTFALAHHYGGRRPDGARTALVHLDLYRLEAAPAADELLAQEEEEATALGAVLAVEWPERLSALPADAWRLQLELWLPHDPEAGRRLRLSPPPAWPLPKGWQETLLR